MYQFTPAGAPHAGTGASRSILPFAVSVTVDGTLRIAFAEEGTTDEFADPTAPAANSTAPTATTEPHALLTRVLMLSPFDQSVLTPVDTQEQR